MPLWWKIAADTLRRLGARLLAAAASDTFIERFASGLSNVPGIGALAIVAVYILVGFCLWRLKGWARTVSVGFAGFGLGVRHDPEQG